MNFRLHQFVAILLLNATGCALFGIGGNPFVEQQQALKPEQVASFENDAPVQKVVRLEASIISALS